MQINYDKQSNALLKNDNLVKNYEIKTAIKNYTLNSYFNDAIWSKKLKFYEISPSFHFLQGVVAGQLQ